MISLPSVVLNEWCKHYNFKESEMCDSMLQKSFKFDHHKYTMLECRLGEMIMESLYWMTALKSCWYRNTSGSADIFPVPFPRRGTHLWLNDKPRFSTTKYILWLTNLTKLPMHTLIVNSIFKNAVEVVQCPLNGELSKREIVNNDATHVANQNNNGTNLEND